jgi:hypothetical protein
MTEIKKTLTILKARWREVLIIIGIHVVSLLFYKLMLTMKRELTPMQGLTEFGYYLLIILILWILMTGFQRTVYLQGKQRQSPTILLRTGWYFLGRILKLFLIWLPVYCILIWLTFLVTKRVTPVDTGFSKTAQSYPLLYQFYFVFPALILIKPVLFVPALIIVLDCQVSEGFKYLKKCRLFQAREPLVLFLILILFSFSWALLPKLNETTTISQLFLVIFSSVFIQVIGLMATITAVRFVASLGLLREQQPRVLDFEDLRKYSNRDLKE